MAVGAEIKMLRYRSIRSSLEIKTGSQRYERPVYDYAEKLSPCREACPTGHDIPLALFLIAQGRPDLAYKAFREESPFPAITGRVCYHPCELACNRAHYDQPLSVAQLERFAAENAGLVSVRMETRYDIPVAVVGSGPSGLACAYHLRRLGYPVTVYEAGDAPGGALRYGIPAYRLPRAVLDREIGQLEELGVRFRCGERVGDKVSFGQLREEYAAVFLGVGSARARRLTVPGGEREGVIAGLSLLKMASEGKAAALGSRVVVVGGGDVAVDVARVALRLGAQEVRLCAVENEMELPAHPEEIRAAREEGIAVTGGRAPLEIQAVGGALRLVVGRVLGFKRDAYGAVTLEVDRDNVVGFEAENVVYAIGQEPEIETLPEGLRGGSRVAVGEWGDTELPGVFAGGDVSGTYNVVQALGAGKRAAIGIDLYLQKRPIVGVREQISLGSRGGLSIDAYLGLVSGRAPAARHRLVGFEGINLDYFEPRDRTGRSEAAVAERARGFGEVNGVLSREAALEEATRCFNCGFCSMCANCFTFCPDSAVLQRQDWGFEIDLDHCKGCGVCVRECPRAAMGMIVEEEL